MLDGECTYRNSFLIPGPRPVAVPINIPVNPSPGCCNSCTFKVLADNSGIATQNDVNTVIWWFDLTTTTANIFIYKYVAGAWVKQGATLSTSNTTYGQFNQFGYYTNNENQKFISLQIDWALIQAAFGNGAYKFTCNYTDTILGNGAVDSFEFCLFTYSPQMAEGTVRLEYTLSGVTEDIDNDTLIKDFGTLKVYNQIRVEGYFGYPKNPYKQEYIEYNDGSSQYVESRSERQFECTLLMVPEWIHAILRTDFMQADELAITDYNSYNNASYITKFVIPDSEYSPAYFVLQNPNSPVELKFKPQFNRSRKLRS